MNQIVQVKHYQTVYLFCIGRESLELQSFSFFVLNRIEMKMKGGERDFFIFIDDMKVHGTKGELQELSENYIDNEGDDERLYRREN